MLITLSISVCLMSCGSTTTKSSNYTSPKTSNSSLEKFRSLTPKLTIKSTPGATIRIMNVVPKYKDGIELKTGRYDILITKKGYYQHRSWVYIDKDTVINKPLEKEKNYIDTKQLPKVEKNYFKYVTDVTWDSHNEAYSLHFDSKTKLVWAVQDALLENGKNHNFKPLFSEKIDNYTSYSYPRKITSINFPTVYEKNDSLYFYPTQTYGKRLSHEEVYRIGSINSLNLNAQKLKWDYPSKNEFINSKKVFKDLTAFYTQTFGLFGRPNRDSVPVKLRPYKIEGIDRTSGYLTSPCITRSYYPGGHEKCAKANTNIYSDKIQGKYGEGHPYPLFLVRKPQTKYEKVIFSALSANEKLELLVSMLTAEKLSVQKPITNKPKKGKYITAEKLQKGEFEKTSDYERRLNKENMKVASVNKAVDEAYQLTQIQYNQQVNQNLEEYKKLVLNNKKESVIIEAANQAAKQAITMLYGDPKFKNVKYDADKEQFTANIYSELNSFSMNVTVPTPIKAAEKFKQSINNRFFVPSVKFSITKNILKFSSMTVVENEFKQEQDFATAKLKGTISAYLNFIKTHPKAPQADIAQQKIDEIHEVQRIARVKAERASKERAKRAADIKAREQKAYMKEKFVGDKVCMSGSMAFGFINPTISGFVEGKNGNNIQIRIADTDGTSPHYNGVTLRANLLIWDSYYSWKHCN